MSDVILFSYPALESPHQSSPVSETETNSQEQLTHGVVYNLQEQRAGGINVAKTDMIMTLAKVIIAAAWADGEVSHWEINALKDLLFHIPEISTKQWAELEIYMEAPVSPEERAELLDELQMRLSSRAEKRLALETLDELLKADGEITPEESEVAAEIRQAIEGASTGLFGAIDRMLSGPAKRRAEDAAAREAGLDDFMRNKVYYRLQQKLGAENSSLDLPDAALRKLSLAGGLMARVAYVDREVTEEEISTMQAALMEHWGIDEQSAAMVAEIATSSAAKDLDLFRLVREFFGATKSDERPRFLRVLFAVAAADGFVTTPETEEIRNISQLLKLTHKQFIEAKRSIPRELRAS